MTMVLLYNFNPRHLVFFSSLTLYIAAHREKITAGNVTESREYRGWLMVPKLSGAQIPTSLKGTMLILFTHH